MVQSAMLVALGFLLATLISLLLAPVVWKRAARLATRRLKESLPISLTDFHAEKDQLRADHAIEVRGLELSLEHAKEKNARQMVDLGRQRAEIMTLTGQIRELRSALSERKSMIAVMEQTLTANVPRLKQRLETEVGSNIDLGERIEEMSALLQRKDQQIEQAGRDVKLREAEILKLRQEIGVRNRAASRFRLPGFRGKETADGPHLPASTLDLSMLDLKEGEKSTEIMQALQQENRRLNELLGDQRIQIAEAKSFEDKEMPLLRQEIRKLGTELLRSAVAPKLEEQGGRAPRPAIAAAVNGANDPRKTKRSLAERLKGIGKLGNEVDA